jgi:hypothetical protein
MKLEAYAASSPEEYQKLIERMRKQMLVPHDGGQKLVIDSTARFKCLNAGRRWGKTQVGAKLLIDEARRKPGAMVWWIGPTYKVVKRGYTAVLKQLPRELLKKEPPPETNFDAGRSVTLLFKNGSKMEFYSAERPEGMLGEGVDFTVLDEAAMMPSRIWEQTVRPTLMDHHGRAILISTPRGKNWFHKRWERGQDPEDPDWESWTFPSNTNPYLTADEYDAMVRELPLALFEQEVLAAFKAAGSAVFYFDMSRQQKSAVPPDGGIIPGVPIKGPVFLGIDLAKSQDYTVLYGALGDTRVNCYFRRFNSITWPEQKKRIRRAARDLMEAGAESVTMVMDSTGVGDPIVEDMEVEGYDVIGLNFTTYKDKMVRLLSKDLEEEKAIILSDPRAEPDEFDKYQMNITDKGRVTYSAPEGEHDDVVSAKMLQHWGLAQEGTPGLVEFDTGDMGEQVPHEDEYDEAFYDAEDDVPEPWSRPQDLNLADPEVWNLVR